MRGVLTGRGRMFAAGVASVVSGALLASLVVTPGVAAPADSDDTSGVRGGVTLGDGEVDDRDQNVDGLEEPVEVEESFSARLTAVSSGRRVEDVSQRTESTRTYANPDGTWTLEDLGEPAYVQGEDGQWQDVDLTLVKRADGTWGPKVSPTDVTIGGGDVVSVVLDEEESRTATLTWPQDLPEPTVEGPVATFAVSDTSDLVVTANVDGASYVLRLNEAPDEDDPVFGFDLLTTGMTVVEDDGALVMEDKKGEAISAPAPVIAWDASVDSGGDPNNVVALDAEVSDGVKTADGTHTRVELSAPQGFLTDPDTVYPVVIDPAISKASSLRDTWVRSGTAAQGSDYKLNVGRTGDIAGEARAYLQWQDELKAAGTEVVKAELKLYQYYAESCSTSVRTNIHPLSSAFTTNTTWADRPGVNTASINPGLYFTQNVGGDGCTGVSNGYVTADVTAIYKGWYDNKFDNYGLVLNVPTAEANNKNFGKRFCSWNELSTHATCNTSSRSPVLSVTYSVKPNTPSAPTFSSTNAAGYSNAASLAVTARGTDPYGDRVKYTIEAVNSSNTVSKSCTTALVASNTAASCNLTGLADGTYKLRAKTTDEFGHVSGYSGTTTLIYDRTVPVKPTITASAYVASGLWLEQKPASNTFTMRASNAEVQRFEYQQDNGTVVSVAVSGATPTATVNWNPAGSHTLKVVAVDKANNKSDATIFAFGNGPASITSPTNAGVKTTASHVVKASAPVVTGSTITAKVQWRAYGTGQTTWKDADGSAPTVVVSGATATATGSFNAGAAVKDVNGEDRSRKHTVLDVRVCFVYASGSSTSTSCTWTSDPKSHATLTYVPHAFGSNFPVADAGPGQVAQWTGEFNTSTTDISVPGYLGELTVSRSFSTFNNQQDGPFGKGWKPSFDGVDAGVAGFEIVDDTTYNGTILLVDEEENALIYSQGASKVAQKVGTYTAVDDETAQVGARLEIKTVSNVKKLVFTEDDGTVTTWTHAGAGVWKPESVQVAGDPSTTQFVHDGQGRLKQIIAPQPVGVTCAPPSFVPGCRVLTLEYGTTAGEKKVQSVAYTAYDQSSTLPTKMETHTVAQYTYNNDGYLIEVKDPRSNLSTSYTYAPGSIPNVRRLTSVTPSGLEGYTIEYKDGAPTALFTDGVTAVKRGSTYTGAFTYDLSVSDSKLPRMEKADVSKWGQETPPTKVFAAFGQDSAGAARSSVTADLLKKADITYTDDEGRVINTASYSGGGGGGDTARWLFTATGYDSVGNVIRQLDERGIDQILAIRSAGGTANSDEYATITRYNPEIITASAVTWGSGDGVTTIPAGTVVTPAATLVTDVWEPVREIVDGDGQVTLARQHTATTYDQGAPNQGINPETGLPFRLATTTRVTLAQPGSASSDPSVALPTDEPVLTEQRMGYDPVDGASVTGKTSGWMIGAPTTLTTENGDQDITVKTVFDEQGRTVKEIGADSNGSDAGTTITHYYDARTTANGAPAGLPSQCVNKPAWAGFVCQIVSGEATPSIPVETVTQYSYYMAAAITTESLDGVTRTATTTFDTAGRVEKATTAVTGLTGSTPQPTAKNVYDPATGLQVETQTLGSGDSVTAAVKTQHDSWGRVVKYTDEHGQATTITYDSAGRVSQETSPKFGNTTYTYDPYSGSVIGKQIAGVGEFTAHYSAFGDIVSQTLPTGVVQASSYDRSGQETALTYTVTGDDGSASFAWMMHHDALGRINQISGPGSDGDRVTRYGFDQAARMTAAYDQIGEACTTREYSFDTVGRRTGQVTKTQSCTDAGAPSTSTKVWAYDKADRILSGANGVGSYVYDALGRQTTLPGVIPRKARAQVT